MFDAKVIRSLGSIMGAIKTTNSTLSATSLLVSLTQGDNSFFIFLPWHNPYNIPPLITPQSVNRQGPLGLIAPLRSFMGVGLNKTKHRGFPYEKPLCFVLLRATYCCKCCRNAFLQCESVNLFLELCHHLQRSDGALIAFVAEAAAAALLCLKQVVGGY